MKYLSFTYIDSGTLIPVSKEPSRRGPMIPDGITVVFHDSDSFSSGVPIFYGTSEDNYQVLDWMLEYSKEEFIDIYKKIISKEIQSKLDKYLLSRNRLKSFHSCLVDSKLESNYFKIDGFWYHITNKQLSEKLEYISNQFLNLTTFQQEIECEFNSLEDLKQAASKVLEIEPFKMEN